MKLKEPFQRLHLNDACLFLSTATVGQHPFSQQRFYFSVTNLLLITADFSASANQITEILHPHDLLKPLFSSETPQARHLLLALLSTHIFLPSSYRRAHWALNCHWFPSPKFQSFSVDLSKAMWSGLSQQCPSILVPACLRVIIPVVKRWSKASSGGKGLIRWHFYFIVHN